jgi:hypothetical protein
VPACICEFMYISICIFAYNEKFSYVADVFQMRWIENSLYDPDHCFVNNIKDVIRCWFNVQSMAFTATKQSYEQVTLKRFLTRQKIKGQRLLRGGWSASPSNLSMVLQLIQVLPQPTGWPGFGTDLAKIKLKVLYVYVLYLSCICPVFVLYLSCICPSFIHAACI